MLDMLKRYPLSEFQQNTDDFMVMLKESQQPIVLTIDGEDALVVEDAIAYQEKLDRLTVAEEQINELKLVALRRDIQVGIDQLENGQYIDYTEETIDDLFDKIVTEGRAKLGLEAELDRRQAAYDANPEPLLTWEEVQANILAKYA